MTTKINYSDHNYYTNRELSWLAFNDRVLEEARDKTNPLLERLKFLSITQSNLDEFFSVRVASLTKLAAVNYPKPDASGMTAEEQLLAVNKSAHQMFIKQYNTLNRSLLPALAQQNIHLLKPDELTPDQLRFIKDYFHDTLYPVLTPTADDSSRPFPFIANDALNLAIQLNKDKTRYYATLQIPDNLPRLIKLPGAENDFILVEDVIKPFLGQLFVNYTVKEAAVFRVIRDLDLDVAEEDTSDLLKEVQQQLKLREQGSVIRLEVESTISKKLLKRLGKELNLKDYAVYEVNGPIDLTVLSKLASQVTNHADLSYKPFTAYQPTSLTGGHNIFEAIRRHDRFLQHPYDKFDPVIEFIRQSAMDPGVLAIKMTLYRVSGDSPIIAYLGRAAQNGKQVTVLVEVKARFDEQNNVHWAKQLEKMGCHVIYGLIGLKTHCKLTLVVRREQGVIRRYMHMATGNYNDVTARFYTDMGLFTVNADMGIDATNIFNMLSGYSEPPYFHQLHISPHGIRDFINDKLTQATEMAKAGKKVRIRMKMNSLSDQSMIAHLYKASHAGVKISLLIRGICCLKTGIPDVSDNITVHSIVGRFLEHSRVFIFNLDGQETVYLSSADLMTRNLNRRVELLFPINDPQIKKRVLTIYKVMWNDNVKTRVLQPDDTFKHVDRRGHVALDAQAYFADLASVHAKADKAAAEMAKPTEFQPMLSPENQPNPLNYDDGSDPH
ncbi:RNA degradosome polyphosphate kinase [Secundilactobacillus paracollinoides]|uniref:Polyphosphate kinase n=1 Tax=Secundilactobacillus paracollinoides TaxID=240427 RepID=A0A1B2IZS7_9LACO|nr:RNA degradosome polyphosphate kinase [Secundilactobacillus paracollinoides]ANZ63275.1 RNA degradosome polyphosphate kinase [Secundilactobacillus paracollinoides]ANZ67553.1 RNA degradosome polyphosphate kinase [Secundilactobacillus paracollinoides]